MVSQPTPVATATIKERIPTVIKTVKETLRVGCSVGHALEISAAVLGFDDYNTLKGMEGYAFYSLRAEIGTKHTLGRMTESVRSATTETLYTYKNVGSVGCIDAAEKMADFMFTLTPPSLVWELCENGKPTGRRFQPNSEGLGGLRFSLDIQAHKTTQVLSKLKAAVKLLERGIAASPDTFATTGIEYTLRGTETEGICSNDLPLVLPGAAYGVFDKNKLMGNFEYEDKAISMWERYRDHSDTAFLQGITIDEALQLAGHEYQLRDIKGELFAYGDIDVILRQVKETSVSPSLFLYRTIELGRINKSGVRLPLDDIDNVQTGYTFAIGDDNGIIASEKDEEAIDALWEARHTLYPDRMGDLVSLQGVSLNEAAQEPDALYYLFILDGEHCFYGDHENITRQLIEWKQEQHALSRAKLSLFRLRDIEA
jgi:hypothetical protein